MTTSEIIYSRYGEKRTVTKVEDNVYLMEGKSTYMRYGADKEKLLMMDPQGGPFLHIGDEFITNNINESYGYISELTNVSTEPGYFKILIRCQHEQIKMDA